MAVKLVLVVRTDLGMGRGKIAAQAAHAAVAAALAAAGARTADFAGWLADGEPKVVLRVAGEDQLLDLAGKARAARLPVELVADAGRTQVAAGTLTCCAIGPASAERIDAVTSGLSLL